MQVNKLANQSSTNKSIEITNGYLIYGYQKANQFTALKNFNYSFDENKIYCIIGESGSGKSTLISLFNGLSKLTYGDINISGNIIRSKRDLNAVCLSAFKVGHKIIMKVASDAREIDVKSYLLSHCDNKLPHYKLLKSAQLKKLKIKNKVNKFYELKDDASFNFNFLKFSHDKTTFSTVDETKIKRKGVKQNKRIKNYKELRKQIGMVSQFPEFQLFRATVLDDVTFGPRILGDTKDLATEKAKYELAKLRIPETHFENSPFNLSGGQKRRVAIAGILAINGSTLIFDEPTAGLDPVGEQEMLNIIKDAKKDGKTVFVVTHSMAQVLEIADEVLVIHNGSFVDAGHPYDIFNNKKVLQDTNIEVPYVVRFVNKLVSQNKKYEELHQYKPRTIEDLANYIAKIHKKGKKK